MALDGSQIVNMAVLGPHLYWIDREKQAIERVNKTNGAPVKGGTVMYQTPHLVDIIPVYVLTPEVTDDDPLMVPCTGRKCIWRPNFYFGPRHSCRSPGTFRQIVSTLRTVISNRNVRSISTFGRVYRYPGDG